MRRKHPKPENPPGTLASRAQLAAWDEMTRNFRTCYHCRNVYTTAAGATRCELAHEAEDGRAAET